MQSDAVREIVRLMRTNLLREKLAAGEAALNGWLHLASGVATEAMSQAGFDSLTVDLQHGPLGYSEALPLLQALSASEVTPLARVPWNEPGIIMKLLDAGCYGIICPMVNTRQECERFVRACRYPPQGYRSYGPTRAKLYSGAGYAEHANETVLTFAMIETAEALDNLDEILSVKGLDGVYVGPADLSQSLGGKPGADFEDGPVPEALDTILAATKERELWAGLHNASASYALQMTRKGFQLVTVQSDLGFLVDRAKAVVSEFHQTATEEATSSY